MIKKYLGRRRSRRRESPQTNKQEIKESENEQKASIFPAFPAFLTANFSMPPFAAYSHCEFAHLRSYNACFSPYPACEKRSGGESLYTSVLHSAFASLFCSLLSYDEKEERKGGG